MRVNKTTLAIIIAGTANSNASPANRHLALIRAVLRKARFEWEWIDKVPKVKLYKEAKRRVPWITPDQVHALLAELPPHQRDITLFALATGLRQANVIELGWDQIDMQRRTLWIQATRRRRMKTSASL